MAAALQRVVEEKRRLEDELKELLIENEELRSQTQMLAEAEQRIAEAREETEAAIRKSSQTTHSPLRRRCSLDSPILAMFFRLSDTGDLLSASLATVAMTLLSFPGTRVCFQRRNGRHRRSSLSADTAMRS